MWPTIWPMWTCSPREGRGWHHVGVPVTRAPPASPPITTKLPSSRGSRRLDDGPGHRGGDERRGAAAGDVEALVEAPTVARGAELPDGPRARAAAYREEVPVSSTLPRLAPLRNGDDDPGMPVLGGLPPLVSPSQVTRLRSLAARAESSIRRHLLGASPRSDRRHRRRRAGDPERNLDPAVAEFVEGLAGETEPSRHWSRRPRLALPQAGRRGRSLEGGRAQAAAS